MTLQDALKSGKCFKRPHHGSYVKVGPYEILYWLSDPVNPMEITKSSILATDWELAPDKSDFSELFFPLEIK